jgi:3-oxoacyl-(acyl-carrier-protein) synthase
MNADDIAITGIGMVSVLGTDAASVWNRLNEIPIPLPAGMGKSKGEIDFAVNLPASSLRRVSRYSRLALAGAVSALEDAGLEIEGTSEFRRGSIFITGYGSSVYNLSFAESAAKGDPDSCSPTLFAGTVANSCVGQVCMQLNLKGPSTVLMGGNPFAYSKLLLETNRADVIFTGAVEEYNQNLWESLKKNPVASELVFNEASVVFTLSKAGDKSGAAYCIMGDGASAGLGVFPPIARADPDLSGRAVGRALLRCIEKNSEANIDFVFSSPNGLWFDEAEARALSKALPRASIVPGVKSVFGETLGCSFGLNVAIAAMCLKRKSIPRSLTQGVPYDADFRNVLVTGFDVAGNYHCLVLRRLE